MKQYEAYKDSGIQWIGIIPEGWKCLPMKRGLTINNGKDYKDIQSDKGYPVIGSGGSFAFASDYLFDGEVVLLGRKGTIDKPLYFNGKFWTVDTMFYAVPKANVCCKYMYYQSLTIPFGLYSTNTALPSMTQTVLAENPMCFPPLAEQEVIAAYLDQKVGKIDAILSEKEAMVEQLQQYRKSLISETVTRGLDPDVPMKDSGIDWIGQIPQHWITCRIKHVLEHSKDCLRVGPFGSSLSGNDFTDKGYWVYNQRTVLDNNFSDNDTFVSEKKFKELSNFRVSEGDFLITTRGTIGKVAIVPNGFSEGVLHPCIIRFRVDEERINKDFLKYIFNDTDLIATQVKYNSNSTTIDVIYSYTLKELQFVLPPIQEQTCIVDFLKGRIQQIDNTIIKLQSQIKDLKAYKSSVITEAVTGKVDLRDWKPSEDNA